MSVTANYHYLRLPSRTPTGPELDLDRLAVLLLTELCHLERQDDCTKLLEQIRCSRTVMNQILERADRPRSLPDGVVDAFVHGEQAMLERAGGPGSMPFGKGWLANPLKQLAESSDQSLLNVNEASETLA